MVNTTSGTVTPITTATGTAGPPITVGKYPMSIAITPNGQTAYVANYGSGTVTAIATATDRVTAQIEVGRMPQAVLVTPDGKTAYVANFGSNSVSPIDTATNKAAPAIAVGSEPYALAIVPQHQSMYVVNYGSGTVTPVSTATNKAGRAVRVGTEPESVAFTADGGTAVVANEGSNNDTTIDTATGVSSTSPVGNAPVSVLIIVVTYGPTARPDRFTLSVCDSDNGPVPTGRNGYVVVTAGPGYEVRRTRPEEFGPLPAGGSRSPCPISSADKAHCNVYRWALSLGRSRCRPAMAPYMSSMRALATSRRSCYAAHDVAGLGCPGFRLQRARQARSSGPDGSSGRDGHITARQRRPVAAWIAEQEQLPALACTDHDGRPGVGLKLSP